MTVLERLRLARAKIDQGWTQGRYQQTRWVFWHSYCALGAIRATGPADPIRCAAGRALNESLKQLHPDYRTIISFNDHALTAQADVLALYDHAIANAESQEKALQPQVSWARDLIANLPPLPAEDKTCTA